MLRTFRHIRTGSRTGSSGRYDTDGSSYGECVTEGVQPGNQNAHLRTERSMGDRCEPVVLGIRIRRLSGIDYRRHQRQRILGKSQPDVPVYRQRQYRCRRTRNVQPVIEQDRQRRHHIGRRPEFRSRPSLPTETQLFDHGDHAKLHQFGT